MVCAEDVADILSKLAALRGQGLLSGDEFAAAKLRLLDKSAPVEDTYDAPIGLTPSVLPAAGFALLLSDCLRRICTLTRAQILAWVVSGAFPCAAFLGAMYIPADGESKAAHTQNHSKYT